MLLKSQLASIFVSDTSVRISECLCLLNIRVFHVFIKNLILNKVIEISMEIDYGLKQDYLLTECCIACLTEKGHLHGETITINCYKEFIDTRVIYTNEFDV